MSIAIPLLSLTVTTRTVPARHSVGRGCWYTDQMEPTIEQGGSSADDVLESAQFNSQLGLQPLLFVLCLNFPLNF